MTSLSSVSRSLDHAPFQATSEPVPAVPAAGVTDLERLHDVPVELTVEIGRTRMTIGQALALGPGSIVSLQRLAGEPVDLLVNGKPIACGEVVVIDEEFGLRITELIDHDASGAAPSRPDPPEFTAGL